MVKIVNTDGKVVADIEEVKSVPAAGRCESCLQESKDRHFVTIRSIKTGEVCYERAVGVACADKVIDTLEAPRRTVSAKAGLRFEDYYREKEQENV